MDGPCLAAENRQIERDTQSQCAVLSPLAGDQLELIPSDLALRAGAETGLLAALDPAERSLEILCMCGGAPLDRLSPGSRRVDAVVGDSQRSGDHGPVRRPSAWSETSVVSRRGGRSTHRVVGGRSDRRWRRKGYARKARPTPRPAEQPNQRSSNVPVPGRVRRPGARRPAGRRPAGWRLRGSRERPQLTDGTSTVLARQQRRRASAREDDRKNRRRSRSRARTRPPRAPEVR